MSYTKILGSRPCACLFNAACTFCMSARCCEHLAFSRCNRWLVFTSASFCDCHVVLLFGQSVPVPIVHRDHKSKNIVREYFCGISLLSLVGQYGQCDFECVGMFLLLVSSHDREIARSTIVRRVSKVAQFEKMLRRLAINAQACARTFASATPKHPFTMVVSASPRVEFLVKLCCIFWK